MMAAWTDKDGNFWVIWPENRKLTPNQVLQYHTDACDNGEIADTTNNPITAARNLADIGHFTFADTGWSFANPDNH